MVNSVILELDTFNKDIISKKVKTKDKTKDKTEYKTKDKFKNYVLNTHILEKRDMEKNSSFELDTWLQTSYNNVLLKKKFLDLQIIVVFAMCIVSTVLATWLVADNYLESHYREKFKGNILIPILNNIIGVLSYLMIFFLI